MSLKGKTAVVTGGASGIGFATARYLARDGARVALWDQAMESAQGAAEALQSEGYQVLPYAVDVSSRMDIKNALEQVHAAYGAVHILVNSAGITANEAFLDIDDDAWGRVMSVNLNGVFYVTQAILPDMLEGGWGRIINITSSSAQTGAKRMCHYAASKGGVISLTRSLALELAKEGITVNHVPPSFIQTPMQEKADADGHLDVDKICESPLAPMGRPGRPENIAAACAFLASEDADFITGQTIGVNGGRVIA